MKYPLIVLFSWGSFFSWAQDDMEVTSYRSTLYDSVRSTYIRTYPDDFFLWPVIKQRNLDFVLQDRPDRQKSLTYKSNKPTAMGLGMYIFELGIEFTFAIPLNEKQKAIYGESKARDLQLNILSKKWGLDMYFQKYSGFYLTDPDVVIPPNLPFPQRADISTRNIGVTGNYVFNNRKFSFRSAYNYAERQMRSAGSFLLFSSINGFTARGDSALLSESYRAVFDTDTEIREIKSTTFGIAPGYTYSFIHKGFFINATLALGPAHNWLSYVRETGQRKHDIEFTAITVARIALGYNGDRFFGGLSYVRQGSRARFDTIELSSSTGTFKVLFGFRFKEVGFLKHRVGDIPEALGF